MGNWESSSCGGRSCGGGNDTSSAQSAAKDSIRRTKEPSEEQLKLREKRAKVLDEFYSTEKSYTSDVNTCVKIMFEPLQQMIMQKTIKLPLQAFHDIFQNVDRIAALHKAVWEEMERMKSELEGSHPEYHAVLIKFNKVLRMEYAAYVASFDKSCLVLEESKKKESKLKKFLDSASKDLLCHNLDINAFLIMPVQRIPRYKMLLEQLKKFTDAEDPMFTSKTLTSIDEALHVVSDIAEKSNEQTRHVMSIQYCLNLHQKFNKKELTDLIGLNRSFIKEGVVKIRSSMSKDPTKLKDQTLVLFRDSVLWFGEPDRFKGLIEFEAATEISIYDVKETWDGKQVTEWKETSEAMGQGQELSTLLIIGSERSKMQSIRLLISFTDSVSCNTWFQELLRVLTAFKDRTTGKKGGNRNMNKRKSIDDTVLVVKQPSKDHLLTNP